MPPLRIFSAVGPGDVVGAHDDWTSGIRTLTETSLTFSGQLLDFLKSAQAEYWLVSSHADRKLKRVGASLVENRPKPVPPNAGGWRFHWGALRYAASLAASARRFKATHAVIDSGTTHWFALALFRLVGIQVIPNFHNVYRPIGHEPRGMAQKAVDRLNRWFFTRCAKRALGVSATLGRQVQDISSGRCRFFEYRAQFAPGDFDGIAPPTLPASCVHVMYAGRVEANKGALDLIEVCRALQAMRPGSYLFEVCGDGSARMELERSVQAQGLSDSFRLHGKLPRPRLLDVYRRAHFVIVPTQTSSGEGLPMVCAEAVLCGRPVVTSWVSNALEALSGAVIEAQADDPADYARGIAACVEEPARYQQLVAGTHQVRMQFIDRRHGFESALRSALLDAAK